MLGIEPQQRRGRRNRRRPLGQQVVNRRPVRLERVKLGLGLLMLPGPSR
jgi:hypothetical protein